MKPGPIGASAAFLLMLAAGCSTSTFSGQAGKQASDRAATEPAPGSGATPSATASPTSGTTPAPGEPGGSTPLGSPSPGSPSGTPDGTPGGTAAAPGSPGSSGSPGSPGSATDQAGNPGDPLGTLLNALAQSGATLAASNAVTKGSFTVYADPANPQPFQDYQLHILVKLPPGTQGYQQSDLSGNLVGSDGYTQSLQEGYQTAPGALQAAQTSGGHTQKQSVAPTFTVNGTQAELVIWVPGAATKVQDTVNVSSAYLNETQSITINFQ